MPWLKLENLNSQGIISSFLFPVRALGIPKTACTSGYIRSKSFTTHWEASSIDSIFKVVQIIADSADVALIRKERFNMGCTLEQSKEIFFWGGGTSVPRSWLGYQYFYWYNVKKMIFGTFGTPNSPLLLTCCMISWSPYASVISLGFVILPKNEKKWRKSYFVKQDLIHKNEMVSGRDIGPEKTSQIIGG